MKAMTRPPSRAVRASRANRFAAIPIPLRLGLRSGLAGRGVTMAILDAGFRAHADLGRPRSRIKAFHDVIDRSRALPDSGEPEAWEWHGTQTAVVAAGDGALSGGLYRSLAPAADLVLVKTGVMGRVTNEDLVRALQWIARHRRRYGIRIVSVSLGGDDDDTKSGLAVVQAAEKLVEAGVVVVAAAGNRGCQDRMSVLPPANAPSVITVGGYDDGNRLDLPERALWCSSFGPTADGVPKPDLLAPANWVAAPILPGTPLHRRASALSEMLEAPDFLLPRQMRALGSAAGLDTSLADAEASVIRQALEARLAEERIISPDYQHVDGTSFAAPIVSSVVAQILEAVPDLRPHAVKRILCATADALHPAPARRQGFGALNPARALQCALARKPLPSPETFRGPERAGSTFRFFHHAPAAATVLLAASFNGWESPGTPMRRDGHGVWTAEVGDLPPGEHAYKFLVDGVHWMTDPLNALEAEDGYGGNNSLLRVSADPAGS